MMIKFTKSFSCAPNRNRPDLPQDDPDATTCTTTILQKLEKKFGIKLHADTRHEKVNGHLSVTHINGSHIIWLFLYSKNGVFESERNGKIIEQKSVRVKKFTGTFPTESEIKKAI